MRRKRWVGLRSRNFRRTLLVLLLITGFSLGYWLGKQQTKPNQSVEEINAIETQLDRLESQFDQFNNR